MGKVDYAMKVMPMPGESVSGDLTWAKEFNNQLLLTLIDVAGHGPYAHQLAQFCIGILEKNYIKELPDIVLTIEKEIKGTRGLVLGLTLIDISSGLIKYIGVGNVRTRLIGKQCYRFVARPGVLGFTKTRPIMEQFLMNDQDILLMYSDGVTDHFEKNALKDYIHDPIDILPEKIINLLGKNTDDMSCIVARYHHD